MNAPHPLVRQLQSLREAAGLSPNDAARRADIKGNTIRAWEGGVCGPTVHVLDKVAASFGVALGFVTPDAAERARLDGLSLSELLAEVIESLAGRFPAAPDEPAQEVT